MHDHIPMGILRAIEARVVGHPWPKCAEAAGWLDGLRRWLVSLFGKMLTQRRRDRSGNPNSAVSAPLREIKLTHHLNVSGLSWLLSMSEKTFLSAEFFLDSHSLVSEGSVEVAAWCRDLFPCSGRA
jgi:hypothetical protein